MGPRARHATVPAILAVLAIALGACGGSSPTQTATTPTTQASTPTPDTTVEPTPESITQPTPAATDEPTETAAASAAADTFESKQYGYALTLPPGAALLRWHQAVRQWDGQFKVDTGPNPYTDRNAVAEGGLLIIGSKAESLGEFFSRFEASGPRFRGCNAARNRLDVTIGGVPAIGFTQVCGEDARDGFGRVALFKDGRGIGASIATIGDTVAARDRLIELLEGLEWLPE
jgi:hypothetical protein